MRNLMLLVLSLLAMSLVGCGVAVDSSGNVVNDEVAFSDTGEPLSPFTSNPVDAYTNYDIEKQQSFRWVESDKVCFECEGAGTLPRSKVITLKDPLHTCMLCNGRGFLTFGEVNEPMVPLGTDEGAATP